MTWEGFVAHCERCIHTRRQYLRKYPANCTWHGWLPPKAIEELQQAGNTVRLLSGGRYLLNSTAPAQEPVRAKLIGTIQSPQGVL